MSNAEAGNIRMLHHGNVICRFDAASGHLLSVQNGAKGVWHGSLTMDFGCDGEYLTGRLDYRSFEGANTWELPRIVPGPGKERAWSFAGFEETDSGMKVKYKLHGFELYVIYRITGETVEVSADFVNRRSTPVHMNGVAFMLWQGLDQEPVLFDFPGNTPYAQFTASELVDGKPVETGLVNPVIRLQSGAIRTNLIFVDEEEKWGTGVYRNGDDLHMINLAAVEDILEPGALLHCGDLYIQVVGEGDSFASIRELYKVKGWVPPSDGLRDGVLYACHPHGTMDSGFPIQRDLYEYAGELENLHDMGIDHVWLLPIFEHLDRGVYHPTDQRIIDDRYGGDDAVRAFSRRIHELEMTLLFDYVPHGPELDDELGRTHRHWASLRRDGEPQIEWNCLSFDMVNPEYLNYTKELVKEHVARFDVDGARIDCAMGGLTNWKPCDGRRPSNSNLMGGIAISKAIRDGFVEAGKKPLVTPENFNPVPAYAPYTDVFYDMALYRALFDMECAGLTPEAYARELTRWLEAELLSTVPGYVKLRFLGNHDTVTWVWNKSRAVNWYGVDRAKALWVLLSCIDGMPMIYQGDEDPSIYGGEGPDLRTFFRDLFQMRRRYLCNEYETEYLYTGTSVVAFFRRKDDEVRLIAVNLSTEPAAFDMPEEAAEKHPVLVFGDITIGEERTQARLSGCGYAVLRLT